jgi:hypothetical protein
MWALPHKILKTRQIEKRQEKMMRNRWLWLVVVIVLGGLSMACGGSEANEVVACDFNGQTAITVNILNENGQPQRLVDVRYQLDEGAWQHFPEHSNGQAIIRGGPGRYIIRADKPGYTAQEIALTITETSEGSCQVAEQTISLPMSLAVCPVAEPPVLEIEIESDSSDLAVTAVSTKGGSQPITCVQTDKENCAHYTLPLNNLANYTLEIEGLAGIGPMFVENGVISYTLNTSHITLHQNSVRRSFALTGANSLSANFSVTPDEVGCALTDFRTLVVQSEPDMSGSEPFPALQVDQENGIIITDLAAPECDLSPEPYPVTYEATLPAGTPLADVAVLYFLNDSWQNASCEITDGRFLCTAVYPNPLITQPYAFKIVAGGEAYVGTSLPFDNLCIIFD